MKRILLLLLAVLSFIHSSFAQKENNIWMLGYHAGLNFNGGSPVAIKSSMITISSNAAVCDASGQMLFYTSGDSVWDKNGTPMPNGYDMIYPYTCIQGNALIVPAINNPHRYYLFSHEGPSNILAGDQFAGRLYYSIVDMTLNGGFGDIVPGKKGIPLDSSLGTKLIAIAGNSCNIWVLTHKYDTSFYFSDTNTTKFLAYQVTDTGLVTTPVISNVGNLSGVVAYVSGDMVVSSSRTKIAQNSANGLPSGQGTEIYDFSPATGMVSNPVLLDTAVGDIGVAFSPDDSKLYISSSLDGGAGPNLIYQYNLSAGSTAAIIHSVTVIDTVGNLSSFTTPLRLAPDGKIYGIGGNEFFLNPLGSSGADSIFYIAQPNNTGTACALVKDAYGFVSTTGASYGLGAQYVKPIQYTFHTHSNLILTDSIVLRVPSGYFTYAWKGGTTDSMLIIKDTGTYYVQYANYCQLHTDTFYVSKLTAVNILTKDVTGISVYPSPAQENITISISGLANVNGTISIVDATGRTVVEMNCNKNTSTIDVSRFANGLYSLRYADKRINAQLKTSFILIK